jgi:hypothetical protein
MNRLVFYDLGAGSELRNRDSEITVYNACRRPWKRPRWATMKQVANACRKPEHRKQAIFGQSLAQIRNGHVRCNRAVDFTQELNGHEVQEIRALLAQRRRRVGE